MELEYIYNFSKDLWHNYYTYIWKANKTKMNNYDFLGNKAFFSLLLCVD